MAHILRLTLSISLIAMSLVPVAASHSKGVSAYFCSPSGQSLSFAAQASLLEVLNAAGQAPHEEAPRPHEICFACMTGISLLPGRSAGDKADINIYTTRTVFVMRASLPSAYKTGPPLGGRAPPFFV